MSSKKQMEANLNPKKFHSTLEENKFLKLYKATFLPHKKLLLEIF